MSYTIKFSDSNGKSANILYSKYTTVHHKVEYYQNKQLVGENFFVTEYEATKSAREFLGETDGNHFNIF
jgi:hypothetical protein